VPLHPLLVGHHPRPLRNEWHRPRTRHPTDPQAPSTPARHAVCRTRGVLAEHDRLPHRRVTGQERQGSRSLRKGRQQERQRHLGVPHSQVRLDDGPGCELRPVETDERAAESWLHQPAGRIRQIPKPTTIIALPPPFPSEIRLAGTAIRPVFFSSHLTPPPCSIGLSLPLPTHRLRSPTLHATSSPPLSCTYLFTPDIFRTPKKS